jgi:hydrophobic/amphiphilic exporter-1 (mainly G- bacteria), HAE1 family
VGWARETLPAGMPTQWTHLSYQEAGAGSSLPVFALSLLAVFLILAALYEELVAAMEHPAGDSARGARCPARPVAARLRAQRVRAGGSDHADRALGHERDPDRGVREVELGRGASPTEAALEGAHRLRPIVMTAFAFILGCVPLWVASGAESIARQQLGTVVVLGMLTATLIGIFVVPVLFVAVERLIQRRAAPRLEEPAGDPS